MVELHAARTTKVGLAPTPSDVVVNDVHSRLNPTAVTRVERPRRPQDVAAAVRAAAVAGEHLAVTGGRHAMGGQQFAAGAVLVDTSGLSGITHFDAQRGQIEVAAGTQWPELIDWLVRAQAGRDRQWGIRQKQTGADALSLGGALAANIHGRGLTFPPFNSEVLGFDLVDSHGATRTCDRSRECELFSLALGGYGLFGIVTSLRLQLMARTKVQRVVEVSDVERLPSAFAERIADGHLYGDFQFSIDDAHEDFLRTGILSTYRPVARNFPVSEDQVALDAQDWARLLTLAHTDKRRAVEAYFGHYLQTSGQVYWSDTQQLATYLDGYHAPLDRRLRTTVTGSEMITELTVRRDHLSAFLVDLRAALLDLSANVVYGTVRLIEPDTDSALPWARWRSASVVVNLHVDHDPPGIADAAAAFEHLIDVASDHGGTYYLTYHRWARADQVLRCHPALPGVFQRKRELDPDERFVSDWYHHHKALLDS